MAFIVEFEPVGIRLVCEEPLTVAAAARQAGLKLRSVCGGKASCGKCQVRIDPVTASAAEAELAHLTPEQADHGWRLACRTIVAADAKVYIPALAQTEGQVVQTEGIDWRCAPVPGVRTWSASVEPPSLDDQTADLERVVQALWQKHGLQGVWADLPALQTLRRALREGRWQVTVALRGKEIIAAYPGRGPLPVGLAVDVGTTKIACYLVSLETGQTLAASGVMNPQIAYGEDVMSRLEAVMVDPANARRLQQDVIEAINTAAAALCAAHELVPEQLLEVCLVGNTAMHHLLSGLPTRPLAVAPFVSSLSSPLDVAADRLGLRAAPGARAHLPSLIAGFVGSDHLAFLLATGFGEDGRTRLGLDIGTNTEIALQAHGQIISCSTASGPAFEGAHIRHGMRAAPGAIQQVTLDETGAAQCDVIGDGPAVGLCGSGILDAVAELRRTNIIDARGRMVPDAPNVHLEPDGLPAFTLARGSDGQRDVILTQPDIDQILLAKGAIRAGIDILANHLAISPDSIDEIVMAGAFGSYLDPLSAVRLGLLPDLPLERIHAVGNAAGTGARMMLASTECRQRAVALTRRIQYLELTVEPGFNRYFAQGMRLPAI